MVLDALAPPPPGASTVVSGWRPPRCEFLGALAGRPGAGRADFTLGNATLALGAGDRAAVLVEVTRALAASGYPARVTPGSEATP